ncbi:hypothetical protein JKG47_12640 [Acidithiobacillus sp. MC6.1]|nr:hypothetical protein [Acidithiobacillus sp. MC6.1]
MDKKSLEKIIPTGLTGPIREKALDAAVLATNLLHMSSQDVVDRVAGIAKEHGIEPASGRAWMLFFKDVNERIKTSKEIQAIAQSPGAQVLGIGREADRCRARRADERQAAHHVQPPSMTVPDVTGVAYLANLAITGKKLPADHDPVKAARKAANRLFSAEVGSRVNSQSGRNGVYSWDQMATGWSGQGGEDRGAGTGAVGDNVSDASAARQVYTQRGDYEESTVIDRKDRHEHTDHRERSDRAAGILATRAARRDVGILHRKAAMHLKDRDYIGFRTFLENSHILDADHKGRGRAKGNGFPSEHDQDRISTHLMTNLLYTSEAGARGMQPDIMEAIRKLHDLPDPGPLGLDARARDRMEKSIWRLTGEYRDQKDANRNQREAKEEKKAAKAKGAGKRRGPGRDDTGPER